MPELPSGTVTFLFTDIERSTESAAALGDERWAEALQAHRDLLRPAFVEHNGAEVGTEGDSFFVAFARAGDAVQAAIDGQRALADHELRVRMGVHTGEALVREGGYVGHEVHRAKRISDAGHGGQILLSQTTADLVSSHATVKDLGPHRLKDLGEPQRLFQVVADGLANDFPALRSLESFSHNLPAQRSTFVGRESEIALIRKLLDENRIVTLTGVGGCGKTRLALQVGAELLDAYSHGVFFVDLAPISEPGLVAGTVAGAVGVPLGESTAGAVGGSATELLYEFLSRRHCLILLDNCEHLRDTAADIADRILTTCPDVTILATSREGLEIEGERAFTIPSMSLPENGSVESSEAVSLFKTRAVEVRPGFDLTPDNVGAVISICRRLDGIPLAIEFAASRISHLTPHEIDDRLAESFRLLAGGRRRVQRQQTIEATLDWSHDLLTDLEKIALRRLAVFAGSFTLEAAEGIISDDQVPQDNVLDLLASLVAKSLATAEEEGERSRYRLLETVRIYAAEKLKNAGEAEQIHSAHRDWYLDWVEAIPWDYAFTSFIVTDSLDAEHGNLIAALEWSAGEDRADLIARMAGRMFGLWSIYGDEGLRWTTYARPEDLDISTESRLGCLMAAAQAAMWLTDADALEFADRAIAAADDKPSAPLAMTLMQRAMSYSVVAGFSRDAALAEDVRRQINEAYAIGIQVSPFATAYARYMHAFAETTMGNFEDAVAPLEESIRLFDPDHHKGALMAALSLLTSLLLVRGDRGGALVHAERAVTLLDTWRTWKSGVVATASTAFADVGELDRAKELLSKWIDDIRRSGMPGSLEEALVGFAAVAAIEGHHERSSLLLAWVRSRTLDQIKPLRSPVSYPLFVHYIRMAREAIGKERGLQLREVARAMSEDEAVAFALEGLGTA
ncbi:MAG TPA: adenylate/guanylate cyclase domain-containing protein [Actinomycetota bacterium]|nr:adenylate/guanylate cyclase domain-containing protein [Actinomycetota bacterium]